MEFEHHLKALVYYHLEDHVSAQELIQELQENDFARQYIAPPDGIKKSSFSEAINSRGLEQFLYVFEQLYRGGPSCSDRLAAKIRWKAFMVFMPPVG